MTEVGLARDTDEARARHTNELVDQMRLEMENLTNENILAREENHSLRAERKYREIFLLLSLVVCVIVGRYFGFDRDMDQLTTMHVPAQNMELLRQNIDELKRQIRRGNIDSQDSNLEKQTFAGRDWTSREMNELVDQIRQELAGLKSENQLAKQENNSLKTELGKYRVSILVFLLIVCVALGLCFKIVFDIDHQANRLVDVEKRVREIQKNTVMQNWGKFVWPIDQWAAKSQSARDGTCERIFSEVFYSHKNGYKMCLSVYPNGCDTGKGTHLSVYFRLMRGPFDNILPWPFKKVVKLSLIDQNTRTDHVSDIITFDKFPDDLDWDKPFTEKNGGIGAPKLIELATLSSNAGLCWDDKIFIRCTVK